MKYVHLADWNVYTGSDLQFTPDWMKRTIANTGDKAVDLYHIVHTYDLSIKALFDSTNKHPNVDFVALPLLFLLKHSLEIGMKHMIYMTYLYEVVYGDGLRGRRAEVQDAMSKKKAEITKHGHKLTNIFNALRNQLEALKAKTNVDCELELNSGVYQIYLEDDGQNLNSNLICKEILKDKIGKPLPYFEILEELCNLLSDVLDPFDSAFKYDLTLNGGPALKTNDEDCINIALILCHYFQISFPLCDFSDLLRNLFAGFEEQ